MADKKKKGIKIETPETEQETAAEGTEKAAPETAEQTEAAAQAAEEDGQGSAEQEKAIDGGTAEETDAPQEAEAEASEEAAPAEEADGEQETKSVGGFFKKKAGKDKKDEQIEELTDRLQRQMAEFENFRRRTEKEKAGMYDMGARDIVEKLLPVIDNFERGLASAEEGDPFAEGMKMIYKQMMTMLTDVGVEPMDAAGKEFDPNLHNAVMHVDDGSLGENIVVEELQKGYMYKDHVVRHSMVKVAN